MGANPEKILFFNRFWRRLGAFFDDIFKHVLVFFFKYMPWFASSWPPPMNLNSSTRPGGMRGTIESAARPPLGAGARRVGYPALSHPNR